MNIFSKKAIVFLLVTAAMWSGCGSGEVDRDEVRAAVPPVVEPAPEPDLIQLQTCPWGKDLKRGRLGQLIELGVLNDHMRCGPLPHFKAAGKPAGTVTVDVVVDKGGTVVRAKCDDADKEIASAAVKAAKFTYFDPLYLRGDPQSFHGIVIYAHSPSRGVWLPAKMPVVFDPSQ